MDVSSVSSGPPSSLVEAQASNLKSATDQQAQTAKSIIDSVTSNAPPVEGSKGQNLAAYA